MSPSPLLVQYGWNDRVAALVDDANAPDLAVGRVTTVDRGLLTVVTVDGTRRLDSRGLEATTGDWLLVTSAEPASVARVLPRWSALQRHEAGRTSTPQLLAANLDVCLVVVGLDRDHNVRRLDRLVATAWDSGALPVVALTKADLITERPAAAADLAAAAVGVQVVATSVVTGQGVDVLRRHLGSGVTIGLIGESGAGKSSLANALIGNELLQTGAVRAGDGKGRHTTRSRQLVPVPGGGVLLDTPGIRGVGLAAGRNNGLDRAFADVTELAAACRFTDCRHGTEPGCAVHVAIASGTLARERLTSYLDLRQEQDAAAVRADARLSRATQRRSGRGYKQLKEHQRRMRGET